MIYPVLIPVAARISRKECVTTQGKIFCDSTPTTAKDLGIGVIVITVWVFLTFLVCGWALDPYANNTFIRVVLALLFFLSPFILLAIFG